MTTRHQLDIARHRSWTREWHMQAEKALAETLLESGVIPFGERHRRKDQ